MGSLQFGSFTDGYYDNENLLPRYVRRLADYYFMKEEEEKKTVHSIKDHESRVRKIREYFYSALGGIPELSGEGEVKTYGRLRRKYREGQFTIEKIAFTSLENTWVTANLYLPEKIEKPVPGVLFLCGHHPLGKAYSRYQTACFELVMSGMAVLAVDPPGQGERYQYWEKSIGRETIAPCTDDHSASGFCAALTGQNILRYFIRDASAGIDYLISRSEIDPAKIGVTGNSGGGTQTASLLLADDRIAAAAPSCYLTLRQSYMASNQAADPEQILAGAISRGLNHDDFVGCFAPKPLLICSAEYDFFCIEGAKGVYNRGKKIYRLYGKKDNLGMVTSPSTHGLSGILIRGIQEWFSRHLLGQEKVRTGPVPEPLHPEELTVTGSGQVRETFNSLTIPDHVTAESKRLSGIRKKNRTSSDDLREAVSVTLSLNDPLRKPAEPQVRIISSEERQGITVEKIFYFPEEDIMNTGLLLSPHGGTGGRNSIIFLTPDGTDEIDEYIDMILPLVENGIVFLILDPRGIGGNKVRRINRFGLRDYYGTVYKLTLDLLMMERSLLGDRVFDVIAASRLLTEVFDTRNPGITGFGYGALPAYLGAALLRDSPGAVCTGLPLSFAGMAETRENHYDYRYFLNGVLKSWDLPDLTRCYDGRILRLIDPAAGTGKQAGAAEAESAGYIPGDGSVLFSLGKGDLEKLWRCSLAEIMPG
ncbi:MAG: alpha/beta hydrolase family protein [Spirochaetia bacterium]